MSAVCPTCGQPVPEPIPAPLPPRQSTSDYAYHPPQQDAGHIARRVQPSFAPGWQRTPAASDADAGGLLRVMMGSFEPPEETP